MPDGQTSLLTKLIIIGSAIGLGKLMLSRERITARVLIGRMIMGAAVSPVAAVPLLRYPDMPDLVVVGLACALGIAGSAFLEECFRLLADRYLKRRNGKHTDDQNTHH